MPNFQQLTLSGDRTNYGSIQPKPWPLKHTESDCSHCRQALAAPAGRALGRLLRRFGLNPGQSLLRRTTPINPFDYGESRGQCIDRYYIENFLAAHANDVRGPRTRFRRR